MEAPRGYEWDEGKRARNLAKHGVDFAAMGDFEWDTARVADDLRSSEPRRVAIGYIGRRLHVVVFTDRAHHRIIRLRKANRREERRYAET